ncbi:hypothetical protein HHI36_019634 [Cryptolaemus montrouzieri]|uniref:Endonuclease/exonuclease/phosphatase domain-containing protein n=1 Tax=Cryptolaemus montrouzieri TaxID=559131 RepID=A0ABD2N8F0_9CUCU
MQKVQVYASTSDYDDDVVESFYEQLQEIINNKTGEDIFIIGDFNAKIGNQVNETERAVGQYGYGTTNERGDTMVDFLEMNQLYAMNTFFQKRKYRKWTWRSPDFKYENEIDFIISSNPLIVADVATVSRVNVGSDHRMIRAKVRMKTHKRNLRLKPQKRSRP